MMPNQPITYAKLEWQENGEPYSPVFKDVYFRSGEGMAETQYVFLQGNKLSERWQEGRNFTIIETGFGTGLNFLATCDSWQKARKGNAKLHYISVEQFPIRSADLKKIYQLWPEFKTFSDEILRQYPPAISGFHTIWLEKEHIQLTLIFGDINAMLPELQAKADAWFLDGFAPKQNPEMWNDDVFMQMARLSAKDASFATFTATGFVRRGLTRAGFNVEKREGFLGKREMLVGSYPTENPAPQTGKIKDAPWFSVPQTQVYSDAIVIGGGLAGTSAAYSLAKRGVKVTLIERHAALAEEASGNTAGILMPLIASPEDIVGQFSLAAYSYAIRHMPIEWQQCGVLQLSKKHMRYDATHPALASGIMQQVSAEDASMIAGVKLNTTGWFFPQAGFVSPKALCEAYIKQITLRFEQEAIALGYDTEWKVKDKNGNVIAAAPLVIIANANDAKQFEYCSAFPLRRVRGQTTHYPASKQSKKLQTILCYEGYMIPAVDGGHMMGATFQPDDTDSHLRMADHEENISMLKPYVPNNFLDETDPNTLQGRVGFRAASPDRRPLVGAVPNAAQFNEDYADLTHGKHYKDYPVGSYYSGLYVSLGHGSRGLVSTPIAAELIASQVIGESLPMEKTLVDALNPARFLIKGLKSK